MDEREYIFLGDGVPVYKDLITERLRGSYVFATAENNLQRAASAAQLGMWIYSRWLIENGAVFVYEDATAGFDTLAPYIQLIYDNPPAPRTADPRF